MQSNKTTSSSYLFFPLEEFVQNPPIPSHQLNEEFLLQITKKFQSSTAFSTSSSSRLCDDSTTTTTKNRSRGGNVDDDACCADDVLISSFEMRQSIGLLLYAAIGTSSDALCDIIDGLIFPPPFQLPTHWRQNGGHNEECVCRGEKEPQASDNEDVVDNGKMMLGSSKGREEERRKGKTNPTKISSKKEKLEFSREIIIVAVSKIPRDFVLLLVSFPLHIALQIGCYDARLRSGWKKLCQLFNLPIGHLLQKEQAISRIDLDELFKQQQQKQVSPSGGGEKGNKAPTTTATTVKKYATIGACTVVGGAVLFITGGLAAPAIAPAFGVALTAATTVVTAVGTVGVSIFGASGVGVIFIGMLGAATQFAAWSALLVPTLTVANLSAIFGSTGAAIVGYKGLRRVGGVEHFSLRDISELEALGEISLRKQSEGGLEVEESDSIFLTSILLIPLHRCQLTQRNVQAAALKMARCVCCISLQNSTSSYQLVLKRCLIDTGVWSCEPPAVIPPNIAAVFCCQNKPYHPTGASCAVCYAVIPIPPTTPLNQEGKKRNEVGELERIVKAKKNRTATPPPQQKVEQKVEEENDLEVWMYSAISFTNTVSLVGGICKSGEMPNGDELALHLLRSNAKENEIHESRGSSPCLTLTGTLRPLIQFNFTKNDSKDAVGGNVQTKINATTEETGTAISSSASKPESHATEEEVVFPFQQLDIRMATLRKKFSSSWMSPFVIIPIRNDMRHFILEVKEVICLSGKLSVSSSSGGKNQQEKFNRVISLTPGKAMLMLGTSSYSFWGGGEFMIFCRCVIVKGGNCPLREEVRTINQDVPIVDQSPGRSTATYKKSETSDDDAQLPPEVIAANNALGSTGVDHTNILDLKIQESIAKHLSQLADGKEKQSMEAAVATLVKFATRSKDLGLSASKSGETGAKGSMKYEDVALLVSLSSSVGDIACGAVDAKHCRSLKKLVDGEHLHRKEAKGTYNLSLEGNSPQHEQKNDMNDNKKNGQEDEGKSRAEKIVSPQLSPLLRQEVFSLLSSSSSSSSVVQVHWRTEPHFVSFLFTEKQNILDQQGSSNDNESSCSISQNNNHKMSVNIAATGFCPNWNPRYLPADQQLAKWKSVLTTSPLADHHSGVSPETLVVEWEADLQQQFWSMIHLPDAEKFGEKIGKKHIKKGLKSYVYSHLAFAATLKSIGALSSAVSAPMWVLWSADAIDNSLTLLKNRAEHAGKKLAEILLAREFGNRPVTLFGFSFGANVMVHCLLELHQRQQQEGREKNKEDQRQQFFGGLVENFYCLAATMKISNAEWSAIRSMVSGRVVNVYNRGDWFLQFLFRSFTMSAVTSPIAGVTQVQVPGVENVDSSSVVSSLPDYVTKLREVLSLIPPQPTVASCSAQHIASPGVIVPISALPQVQRRMTACRSSEHSLGIAFVNETSNHRIVCLDSALFNGQWDFSIPSQLILDSVMNFSGPYTDDGSQYHDEQRENLLSCNKKKVGLFPMLATACTVIAGGASNNDNDDENKRQAEVHQKGEILTAGDQQQLLGAHDVVCALLLGVFPHPLNQGDSTGATSTNSKEKKKMRCLLLIAKYICAEPSSSSSPFVISAAFVEVKEKEENPQKCQPNATNPAEINSLRKRRDFLPTLNSVLKPASLSNLLNRPFYSWDSHPDHLVSNIGASTPTVKQDKGKEPASLWARLWNKNSQETSFVFPFGPQEASEEEDDHGSHPLNFSLTLPRDNSMLQFALSSHRQNLSDDESDEDGVTMRRSAKDAALFVPPVVVKVADCFPVEKLHEKLVEELILKKVLLGNGGKRGVEEEEIFIPIILLNAHENRRYIYNGDGASMVPLQSTTNGRRQAPSWIENKSMLDSLEREGGDGVTLLSDVDVDERQESEAEERNPLWCPSWVWVPPPYILPSQCALLLCRFTSSNFCTSTPHEKVSHHKHGDEERRNEKEEPNEANLGSISFEYVSENVMPQAYSPSCVAAPNLHLFHSFFSSLTSSFSATGVIDSSTTNSLRQQRNISCLFHFQGRWSQKTISSQSSGDGWKLMPDASSSLNEKTSRKEGYKEKREEQCPASIHVQAIEKIVHTAKGNESNDVKYVLVML